MNRRRNIFMALFLVLMVLSSSISAQAAKDVAGADEKYVQGEIVVKVKEGKTLGDDYKTKILKAEKIVEGKVKNPKAEKAMKEAGLDRLYLIKVKDAAETDLLLRQLQSDSAVEYAEPNYIVSTALLPNDPSFSKLWGLNNLGQTGGKVDADIDAPEAWEVQTGSKEILVAVIDTGVDYNHPDLLDNMWNNPGEIPGDGIDNDGNGYVDDIYGCDFCNKDSNPMDDNNHGTHCAGTIGAVGNNGIGVVGVNHEVSIVAIKFLGQDGSGSSAGAAAAIAYATSLGVDVMSNSWGGGGYSSAIYDAIVAAENSGIIFVAAAGNSGSDNDVYHFYPSDYSIDNIISVAATDHNDNKAYFSNWGKTSVDIGAPGVNIYSTVLNGGYSSLSGTSMACPHVAGAAGLIKAQYPQSSVVEIKDRILMGSDPVPSMAEITVSGGRLNVANSIQIDPKPPVNQPPVAAAGPDQSSFVGETVSFDGSGSSDPDGEIVSYEWNFGDGAYASGISASHIYEGIGIYTVTLKVFDNEGAESTDSLTVQIDPKPDVVTILKAEFFNNKKSELTVWATSSQGAEASLSVEGYGAMNYKPDTGRFELVQVVPANPGTITVKSSLGGEKTAEVKNKLNK